MEPLALAVMGAGLIGRQHIDRIEKAAECRLAAIVDPATDAPQTAKQQGVTHYSNIADALANEVFDGVIIATPNALHIEHAEQCLARNLPILIEKPIAHESAAAKSLLTAERDHGHKILVGHHRVHSPIMETAREIVSSGVLGSITTVMGSAQFYKPAAYFDEALWRTKRGGGPILINLIHEIGNLRTLVGEISSVQAMASSAARNFEVEDTVAITLRFDSGALGTFMLSDSAVSSASWEHTARENPAYPHDPNQDCYQISGTKGSLAVPTMRVKSFTDNQEVSWWSPMDEQKINYEAADPLVRQLNHFCDIIRGTAKSKVSAFDGLQNLLVTEAIAKSISAGRAIEIER